MRREGPPDRAPPSSAMKSGSGRLVAPLSRSWTMNPLMAMDCIACAVMPTAGWLTPVAVQNWITRSCAAASLPKLLPPPTLGDQIASSKYSCVQLRRGLATKSPIRIISSRIVIWEIEMTRGTVKWFNPTKGYGFIQPQAGGKDVFVHISAVERAGLSTLNEGQQIEYEIEESRGKTSAVNLKVK